MRMLLVLMAGALLSQAAGKLSPLDEATYPKTVAAQKGKVVLVNFWATWCVPCRKEMPELAKMAASLKAKNFDLVTISADEPEDEQTAIAFLAKAGITGSAFAKRAKNDDKFINAIEPKWSGALPALILYDKTGKKVKAWIGETDLAAVQLEVKKLL